MPFPEFVPPNEKFLATILVATVKLRKYLSTVSAETSEWSPPWSLVRCLVTEPARTVGADESVPDQRTARPQELHRVRAVIRCLSL